MLTSAPTLPVAKVIQVMSLADTAPIYIGGFVERFRILNERQRETACEISRMRLELMGVGG